MQLGSSFTNSNGINSKAFRRRVCGILLSCAEKKAQIGSKGQNHCVVRHRPWFPRRSAARRFTHGVEVAGLHSPVGSSPESTGSDGGLHGKGAAGSGLRVALTVFIVLTAEAFLVSQG